MYSVCMGAVGFSKFRGAAQNDKHAKYSTTLNRWLVIFKKLGKYSKLSSFRIAGYWINDQRYILPIRFLFVSRDARESIVLVGELYNNVESYNDGLVIIVCHTRVRAKKRKYLRIFRVLIENI